MASQDSGEQRQETMGRVEALCVSKKKGEKKTLLKSARFVADYGIDDDAHAGAWHRQVSLLNAEDIDVMRSKGLPNLKPGDFAENVILSGIRLAELGLGSKLRLSDEVELSVTQIGKVCHTPCAIHFQTGDCIMPRLGVFARVLKGETVSVGDNADVLQIIPRRVFQVVILTISDRCARNDATDTAGPSVAKQLQENINANIYRMETIPDDCEKITSRFKHYCDGHSIDLVISVGGTGFATRDVTPEAVSKVIERPTPGLDEAMRRVSHGKTPHAMLSRSVSGIRGSTLIVSLPGSERAAVENLQVIIPALKHGLAKLRGDSSDCDPNRRKDANG